MLERRLAPRPPRHLEKGWVSGELRSSGSSVCVNQRVCSVRCRSRSHVARGRAPTVMGALWPEVTGTWPGPPSGSGRVASAPVLPGPTVTPRSGSRMRAARAPLGELAGGGSLPSEFRTWTDGLEAPRRQGSRQRLGGSLGLRCQFIPFIKKLELFQF